MLKKFFSKSVALQFTAVRASSIDKTKQQLKNTEFCKCMDGEIIVCILLQFVVENL